MIDGVVAAAGPVAPGTYFGWGAVMIQSGNLAVILAMLVLFILALVLPFPGGRSRK
ncbi:hypothetical protein [Specibacter sp. RAF43]|uniref:hypothetical protein n=1 Tax=Specibacter sp. RAF43 TaxID=3233057 RepID=UPI003F946F06